MSEHITVRIKVDLTNFNRAMRKATIAVRRFGAAYKRHRRRHPDPNRALLARSRKRRR